MRRWLLRPLTGLLVLVLVVVAVLAVLLSRVGAPGSARNRNIATAENAARQIAINISSYDYTKLTQQFAEVASELTGSAATDFQASTTQIKSYWPANKLVTTAQVDDDAVVPGATNTNVVVLVALTVTGRSSGQTPYIDSVPERITLVKEHGTWLAMKVD
jgi:Mce-associated membrane protein